MRRLIAIAVLAAAPVAAQEGLSMHGALATAKMAGACGVMDSMVKFQASTRMEGGEAFVLRFWQMEAARLGKTIPELSEVCNQSVSAYDTLWGTGG